MREKTSSVIAWVIVLALAEVALAPGTEAQTAVTELQSARVRVARLVASGFGKYEYSLGASEAVARPKTRKAWAAAFKVPGQSNGAAAGFELPPVSVGGTIPSARVRATFNVLQAVGSGLTLVVQVERNGVPGGMIKASSAVTGPGSATITTEPFSLQAGGQYHARAFVNAWAGSTQGDMCAAVITVSEIKWEF